MDVIQRIQALGFSITTAGDLAAIHCHTATGTVVVTGPLAAFIATARAERDANGRPFAPAPKARAAIFEADAQAVPPGRKPRDDRPAAVGSRTSPARLALLRSLYARRESTPLKQLAAEAGLTSSGLYCRFNQFAAADYAARGKAPVLKPSGKLL